MSDKRTCPIMSGRLGYENTDPYGSKLDDTPTMIECLEDACAWFILNDTCRVGECSIKTIARKVR